MHPLKNLKLQYFVIFGLVLFGCFYRITTSEFWPITISKTWLTPEQFEFSMLQKPLLTLFLSAFHLLPLSDITHLLLVKLVFALFGALGIWALISFLFEITPTSNDKKNTSIAAGMLCLVFLSPTVLSHFFSVRSDQLATTLFSFFLLFSYRKNLIFSILCLVLIPLSGIKELLFLPAGFLIFYFQFKHLISKKFLFFGLYGVFTVFIWLSAYNVNALYYFLETFEQNNTSSNRLSSYVTQIESLSLLLTTLSVLYIFIKSHKSFYPYAISSLYFSLVIYAIPQSYSFLIGSLLPFILTPLMLVILQNQTKKTHFFTIIGSIFIFTLVMRFNHNAFAYSSSLKQLKYIQTASQIIEESNLHYLDGVGILPRQKNYPCFASPNDQVANTSCLDRIQNQALDSVIITSRLMYVGEQVFNVVDKNYEQILPNLWVHKNLITPKILEHKNINADISPAFILF